jgi:GNAT superfamily N-acetyltransferase
MTLSGLNHLVSPGAAWRVIRARVWSRLELCFYSYLVKESLDLPRTSVIQRDCMEDLRYYERTDRDQMSPDAFLAESQRRRALGNHLYTLVQDGRLVFYGWLVDRQERSEDPLMGQVFFPPEDAAVVFDCYVHPLARGRGLYAQALHHMLHDARALARAGQVCMAAFADNLISNHVIRKVGFRYLGSFIKERRLWITRRYSIAMMPEFRTALLDAPPTSPLP